jgi:site-specific recombinase
VHSAAGGRLLAAFTAAIKFLLAKLTLAPFFASLLAALNYVGSFMLIQLLGFTLATQQPAVTAAALASAIGEGPRERLERLVELIPRRVAEAAEAADLSGEQS